MFRRRKLRRSLTHTATEWTDTRHPRVALFTCYDTVNSMYGRDTTPAAVVEAMSPLRQTLFRGLWARADNTFYDETNRASSKL
jgi:hypothetical protein